MDESDRLRIQLEDLSEPPPGDGWGPDYDWKRPSRAVVACRGGIGQVLWHVGAHMAFEITEGGLDWIDLGLDDAPDGISIWEGVYRFIPEYTEWGQPEGGSTTPEGKFRAPTDAEWEAIREGRNPWDDQNWKLPERFVTVTWSCGLFVGESHWQGTETNEANQCHGHGEAAVPQADWDDGVATVICTLCHQELTQAEDHLKV